LRVRQIAIAIAQAYVVEPADEITKNVKMGSDPS
jgi:hypothetical protein